MDENTTLKQASNVTFENVAGEAILIHLDSGAYFSLNKVGTQFWEMLDGSQTIAEQARILAEQYDVDAAMVRDDLLELAIAMQDENLVEVV
ncbi:MAG: PqqD family protein [Chloroflexota bacterium]